MPEGCDISEHQGYLAPEWFDAWDYVIIRAFNENGRADLRFADNWNKARGRTKRGVYGWPIPSQHNNILGQQLFVAAPDAEAGYWADVERSANGLATTSETEAYLRGIGPHVRGFYSNIGEMPDSVFLRNEKWWMADYGPNNGTRHDPYEQAPRPTRPYTIHQYTSAPLDRNWSESLAWLVPPAPTPPPKTLTEDRMICGRSGKDGKVYALDVLGNGVIAAEFVCLPGEEVYGAPAEAWAWRNGKGYGLGEMPLRFVQPYVIDWTRALQGSVLSTAGI